jgi:D-alanine transfer protein
MDGQKDSLEQTPHLAAALTAAILGVASLVAFGCYARSLEYRSITALATREVITQAGGRLPPLKNQGSALQQAALESDCLLPVYGSSELSLWGTYNRPFHATTLFRTFPTGFTIFPVGKAENSCLNNLQKLCAVGPALAGRKVVVSLSPPWFFERPTARADGYAGNFSALHAGELAFNTHLTIRLRQAAARRMLEYPATLANRPLLRFALENLVGGTPFNLACYDAVLPLGILHNAILRYQDHWSVVTCLWTHPMAGSPRVAPASAEPLDWPALLRQADAAYPAHSSNNEFGMDNRTWDRHVRLELPRRRNAWSDDAFLCALETSREWVDLELLLRALTELGARPLLLSSPLHGAWYEQWGITYTGRTAYYQKLRELGARYHAAVVDFADHDADKAFCQDNMAHLAPRGWVYYSQALDGFFHDAAPRLSQLPARASAPAAVARRATEPGPSSRPAF